MLNAEIRSIKGAKPKKLGTTTLGKRSRTEARKGREEAVKIFGSCRERKAGNLAAVWQTSNV